MNPTWIKRCGVVGLLAAATFIGCAPPEPDQDAILWYFRSARVDGEVRRVWPAGQAYVDKVLTTWAELQQELDALREVTTVNSLWREDDPRWFDTELVVEHTRELIELNEARKPKRALLLEQLEEAVNDVPDAPGLNAAAAKKAFAELAWEALSGKGTDLRATVEDLEGLVADRLRLYRAVAAQGDTFDGGDFPAVHDVLRRKLRERRSAFIDAAADEIASINERMKTIDKRQERDEYSYLFWYRTHLRESLQAIPKGLYQRAAKARAELEELRETAEAAAKPDPQRARKIAHLEALIPDLEADREALQARIDPIIASTEASQEE